MRSSSSVGLAASPTLHARDRGEDAAAPLATLVRKGSRPSTHDGPGGAATSMEAAGSGDWDEVAWTAHCSPSARFVASSGATTPFQRPAITISILVGPRTHLRGSGTGSRRFSAGERRGRTAREGTSPQSGPGSGATGLQHPRAFVAVGRWVSMGPRSRCVGGEAKMKGASRVDDDCSSVVLRSGGAGPAAGGPPVAALAGDVTGCQSLPGRQFSPDGRPTAG